MSGVWFKLQELHHLSSYNCHTSTLRLVAQTALQPGVLTVLKGMLRLDAEANFIYINVEAGHVGPSGRALYRQLRR